MGRSERLARFGSQAAYVSAAALLAFFLLQQYGSDLGASGPVAYTTLIALFDLALWAFIGALFVLALHLESRSDVASAPPSIRSRLRIGRRALAVALVLPVLLVLGQLLDQGLFIALAYGVIFVGVGIGIFVYNGEARRLGLEGGVLTWFGLLAAGAFVIAGIGFAAVLIGLEVLFVIGFYVLLIGEILYVGWATWLAGNLRRAEPARSG